MPLTETERFDLAHRIATDAIAQHGGRDARD